MCTCATFVAKSMNPFSLSSFIPCVASAIACAKRSLTVNQYRNESPVFNISVGGLVHAAVKRDIRARRDRDVLRPAPILAREFARFLEAPVDAGGANSQRGASRCHQRRNCPRNRDSDRSGIQQSLCASNAFAGSPRVSLWSTCRSRLRPVSDSRRAAYKRRADFDSKYCDHCRPAFDDSNDTGQHGVRQIPRRTGCFNRIARHRSGSLSRPARVAAPCLDRMRGRGWLLARERGVAASRQTVAYRRTDEATEYG